MDLIAGHSHTIWCAVSSSSLLSVLNTPITNFKKLTVWDDLAWTKHSFCTIFPFSRTSMTSYFHPAGTNPFWSKGATRSEVHGGLGVGVRRSSGSGISRDRECGEMRSKEVPEENFGDADGDDRTGEDSSEDVMLSLLPVSWNRRKMGKMWGMFGGSVGKTQVLHQERSKFKSQIFLLRIYNAGCPFSGLYRIIYIALFSNPSMQGRDHYRLDPATSTLFTVFKKRYRYCWLFKCHFSYSFSEEMVGLLLSQGGILP